VVGYTPRITPDLYLIEATADVPDPRYPSSPARRTVRQYARLHKNPVNVKGTVTSVASAVPIYFLTTIGGTDQSFNGGSELSLTSGFCSAATLSHLYGTVALTTGGFGWPDSGGRLGQGAITTVLDTLGTPWSVLESASFPVPHQWGVNWPNFSAHPDSFFVARYNGNLAATGSHSGKGVLIVTGTFSIPTTSNFIWQGIVLAGAAANTLGGFMTNSTIQGALVTGLDGGGQASMQIGSNSSQISITNYSCYIAQANRSLAFLELVDGTRWEF
jgi:hypothetical protein